MKRRKPLNRCTKLRPVSARRAAQLKVYRSLKKFVLKARPYCEMGDCPLRRATQIHHMKGREGARLNDTRYWLAVCAQCHDWIHAHPKEARRIGVLLRY